MLEINININDSNPLFQQIFEQVKRLMTSGQLKPGEQIPSVRDLASWLQVNPSTVARAYYDLKQEGLVATSRRRGTIILYKNQEDKVNQIDNRPGWKADDHLPGNLTHHVNMKDMETAFTLHPAYWRVQRTG